jgi:hypothetical protein
MPIFEPCYLPLEGIMQTIDGGRKDRIALLATNDNPMVGCQGCLDNVDLADATLLAAPEIDVYSADLVEVTFEFL